MNEQEDNKCLEARSLTFSYQEGSAALQDVNFHVNRGEFTALLASNGSGKTTLLKVLVNLLKPHKGEVRVEGQKITDMSSEQLYQKVGLVLQNPSDQLFGATVAEDVAFGPRNLGLSGKEVDERVRESLECVGAGELYERAIHHLSFGEQKRVSLAGVLAMRPSILLLDESTAGLDPMGEAQMLKLLNRLNTERGITVVMATHSVDLLPLFAHRLCVLRHGRLLREGTPEEIFTDREMVDKAGLRIPYISHLLQELHCRDGVPIDGMPLTMRDARMRLLELIPADMLIKR